MSPNRNTSWLVAGVLAFLVALPARAAENRLEGFQLFAPAEDRLYGDDPEPSKGYFFTFDGLFWTIGPPAQTYVGVAPNAPGGAPSVRYVNSFREIIQQSTTTNHFIDAKLSDGNRFEFGNIGEENGWMASIYDLRNQDHHFSGANVGVVFVDPRSLLTAVAVNGASTANAPVTFRWFEMENHVDHWSAELSYLRRFKPFHHGGVFELILGARYLEFNEQFQARGYGAFYLNTFTQGTVSALGDSHWLNRVNNHILGPQVGGRWFRKTGRWTVTGEGRFTAGFNRQNYYQVTNLFDNFSSATGTPNTAVNATNPVLASQFPDGGVRATYKDEFAPLVEIRAELRYQLTRAISAHAGWNGVWMDGIARASNTIDYQLGSVGNPVMGFNLQNSRESLFITGFTIGIDVNR